MVGAELATLVNAEELVALDQLRAVLPSGPAFHADLFCRELARVKASR